jgi:hypothetical protein
LAIRLRVWRFDSISNAWTRRAVEEHITEADVLMVAADGRQPLPKGIEIALGEWLLGPAAARLGLVALLRGMSDVQKPMAAAHVFFAGPCGKGQSGLSLACSGRTRPADEGCDKIDIEQRHWVLPE